MKIIKALNILAYPKDKQINYLIELGTFPSTDELAIQFDDAYNFFLGIANENKEHLYDKRIFEILNRIISFFDRMSNKNNNDFWKVSSLGQDEWNNVRELANEALKLMGKPFEGISPY
jgi:hypothetical protein